MEFGCKQQIRCTSPEASRARRSPRPRLAWPHGIPRRRAPCPNTAHPTRTPRPSPSSRRESKAHAPHVRSLKRRRARAGHRTWCADDPSMGHGGLGHLMSVPDPSAGVWTQRILDPTRQRRPWWSSGFAWTRGKQKGRRRRR
jgi:hypothetical protein